MVDPSSDPSPPDPYSEPTNGFCEHSEPEVFAFDPSLPEVPGTALGYSFSDVWEPPVVSEASVPDFGSLCNFTYDPVGSIGIAPVDPPGSSSQVCPLCGGSGLVSYGLGPVDYTAEASARPAEGSDTISTPPIEGHAVHGLGTSDSYVLHIADLATGETRVLDDEGSA
jgi:hypothetical protein